MATKKLTRTQAKAALGDMPERSFARLVSEGLPRDGGGRSERYPWPEIWHWYLDRERSKVREASRPVDVPLVEAERRKKQAEAEIAEMKRDQIRGELVEREGYEAELRDVTSRLRGAILALRGRHLSRVMGLENERQAAQALDTISRDLLEEMRRAANTETQDDEEEPAA